jgi:hypothetical protein
MKVSKVWVNMYKRGKLMGFADVAFSLDKDTPDAVHMIWKGFKLFEGDSNQVQIGLPSRKDEKGKTDDNGKDIYYPVISINRAKEDEPKTKADDFFEYLQNEISAAYNAKAKSQPSGDSVPSGNTGTVGDDDIPF